MAMYLNLRDGSGGLSVFSPKLQDFSGGIYSYVLKPEGLE